MLIIIVQRVVATTANGNPEMRIAEIAMKIRDFPIPDQSGYIAKSNSTEKQNLRARNLQHST
jgi:hypothetical protein